MCFKKVQKLKKIWLEQGLNPQLSWLTNQCFVYMVLTEAAIDSRSLSSLHTSAFNAL